MSNNEHEHHGGGVVDEEEPLPTDAVATEHHGGGVVDEEEPLPTDAVATGPKMSTPLSLPVRQEDVWESEGVRRRGGEEEEEEGEWSAMSGKIDPDDLLRG